MAVSIHNNIVSGPEELDIPAHLSYGQFLFDQLKKGGDQKALVSTDRNADTVLLNYQYSNCYGYVGIKNWI